MKILIHLPILLLCVVISVQGGEKDKEKPKETSDLDRLQGSWQVVSLVEKGKAIPEEELKILDFTIEKDTMTVKEKGTVVVQYKIKIDSEKKPKSIDFTHLIGENKDKTEPGIYVFEKDGVKMCMDENRKGRPTVFEGKEAEAFSVIVLKKKVAEKDKEKEKDKD